MGNIISVKLKDAGNRNESTFSGEQTTEHQFRNAVFDLRVFHAGSLTPCHPLETANAEPFDRDLAPPQP